MPRLGGNAELACFFYVAVGHAGSVEGGGGPTFAVEENQAAGGVHAMRELAHAGVGNGLREREGAGFLAMREHDALIVQKEEGP